LISRDYMAVVEGLGQLPTRAARWYTPDLNISVYSINPSQKTTSLERRVPGGGREFPLLSR